MDLKKVKEFIQLAKDEGVTDLKYESDKIKVSVSFRVQAASSPVAYQPVSAPQASNTKVNTTINDSFHVITSPFVGTFYASAEPGKPSFVSVGSKVKTGDTLCILEAMKIMNEIDSDCNGEIVEVCVENESLVEFGEPLFKIKK